MSRPLLDAGRIPDKLSALPDSLLPAIRASRGGLPDAGGWVLLIGEPVGMLGVLVAVWGDQ